MTNLELAQIIKLLRETHYRYCRHGEWSETCPVFMAWDKRRLLTVLGG